jgi:hypothetical protein
VVELLSDRRVVGAHERRQNPDDRPVQVVPQRHRALGPGQILALQQSIGNHATSAVIGCLRKPEALPERAPIDSTPKPRVLHRREQGSGLDDPLYMADRRWSSGQGPDDRVTGQRLSNWAIACGSAVVRAPFTLMRLQEKDRGAESDVVDDIYALLVDLLRGNTSATTAHILVEGTRHPYHPESETVRETLGKLGRFEGSDNARERAVLELADHWGPIEHYFTHTLTRVYQNGFLEAYGRTPKDMELETDTAEIRRIRSAPYGHEHVIHQGMAGDVIVRVGQRYGRVHVVDVYKVLGTRSRGPGMVWSYVDGHPAWYYKAGVDAFDRMTVVGEVARGVADGAKFAGMLFPLMIKAGGFALSFSPNPVFIIAGVVLEEFGEDGVRDLTGEGRSFEDVAGDAARDILINLVMNRLMGGGGKSEGAASRAGEALGRAADKAAAKVRTAVKEEIVKTEAPQVAKGLEAGRARRVEDRALRDEGFTHEVQIQHDGGPHTYRRKPDGDWCRWSTKRICGLQLGGEVDAAAAKQLDSANHEITSDFDPRSEKLAKQKRGERKTLYEVKKASKNPSDQAEAYIAELFHKDGYRVHFNADDAAGDLTIDGVRTDVKLLTQKRSINSAVERGAGQGPAVIIDGTRVNLTRAETEALIRDLETRIAEHPGKYTGVEKIYIVEGTRESPTIFIHHRRGAPLRSPDPERPQIRGARS